MKKLALSRLDALFAAIGGLQPLYLPADNASGQADFTLWREGIRLSGRLNTVRSAKDLFFPQVENLVDFRVKGKQLELLEHRAQTRPFVLFGVRACDCRSFDILDHVFLSSEADTFYQARRESATVISMACSRPEETCFCGAFGIDAADPAGDVTCWQDGEFLYWRANTEKGAALTAQLPLLSDCAEEAVSALQAQTREVMKKLPLYGLKLDGFGAGRTKALFDRPEWKSLSEACLGCGTCTFVCPTCQCYDIEEFDTGKTIRRFRCWDSCMYSDFTQMSAGQPRPTQLERFRQRFLHKLVYFPENNEGIFGCVGCGRCLAKCPIHMHIVKVIQTLGGKDA